MGDKILSMKIIGLILIVGLKDVMFWSGSYAQVSFRCGCRSVCRQ